MNRIKKAIVAGTLSSVLVVGIATPAAFAGSKTPVPSGNVVLR